MTTDRIKSLYVRNIIFGVEDSLVSTVGLLAGISVGDVSIPKILLTGVVYIFVEGFSMAAGSYLSEHSAQEYETGARVKGNEPLLGAATMFFSFLISGIIPLAPYVLAPAQYALGISIFISLATLAVLGYAQGRISKLSPWRGIIRMIILGGIAIVLGIVIGHLFKIS